MVSAPLRLAFFGTPDFALPTLRAMQSSGHELVVVVTQPDRPRGRGHRLTPSPVKLFALAHGLDLLQPETMKDDAFLGAFGAYRTDLAVVAAYGRILPRRLIEQPTLGTINVHASLLPRWRGAAPVHRAILAGDTETGVTIMRVVPALDAGPMLARLRVAIGEDETSAELEARLAAAGGELLAETVDRLAAEPVTEEPQPEVGVTYASRLDRHERRVDWKRPAVEVHNQIRGLQPWPAATVLLHGQRLKLLRSAVAGGSPEPADAPAGRVLAVTDEALLVATAPGSVRVTRVQAEGGAAMGLREFLPGHRVMVGDRLEEIPAEP